MTTLAGVRSSPSPSPSPVVFVEEFDVKEASIAEEATSTSAPEAAKEKAAEGQQLGKISTWHNKTVERVSGWACCGWTGKLEVAQDSSYFGTMFKVAALSLVTVSLFVFDTASSLAKSLAKYVCCCFCKKSNPAPDEAQKTDKVAQETLEVEEELTEVRPFTRAHEKFLDRLMAQQATNTAMEQMLTEAFEQVKANPAAFQVLLEMVVGVDDADERADMIDNFDVTYSGNGHDIGILQGALGFKSSQEVGNFLKHLADNEDLVAQIVPASSSTATQTVEVVAEAASEAAAKA